LGFLLLALGGEDGEREAESGEQQESCEERGRIFQIEAVRFQHSLQLSELFFKGIFPAKFQQPLQMFDHGMESTVLIVG